jgi:hypothetical protein
MARARACGSSYGALAVVLLLVGAGSAILIASCGSGGSSNGGLCEQCGDTDGPCQPSVPVSGSDAQMLCPSGQTSCDVQLTCLRKLGSAQRCCFPADPQFDQFRCDGARANRSIPTMTLSPTTTATPTPSPTSTSVTPTSSTTPAGTTSAGTPGATLSPTPVPTAAPACGNGVVEDFEECDGADLDEEDCDTLCDEGGGTLTCTASCSFDFSRCAFPATCSAP